MTHILVIEDEPDIRENIAELLEIQGYKVSQAPDGGRGIVRAEEELPDLIICDIMMPDKNGFEVLVHLRSQHPTMLIPFIFLTAISENRSRRHGMGLGADDFISKPFTPQDLISAIEIRLKKQQEATERHHEEMSTLRENIVHALPHEMRTPLAGILGSAQMLYDDADNPQPDEVRSLTQIILRSVERLQHLTENYLIWTQMEIFLQEGQHLMSLRQHELTYPDAIIQDVCMNLSRKYHREPDVHIDTSAFTLHMQHDNFHKIVWELVDNALKFSKPGDKVKVNATAKDDHYCIEITDTGRGMSPEELDRIGLYNQFQRKIYEQQGLGMGLAIARRMVELHKGTFDIQSSSGEGTQVTVKLD